MRTKFRRKVSSKVNAIESDQLVMNRIEKIIVIESLVAAAGREQGRSEARAPPKSAGEEDEYGEQSEGLDERMLSSQEVVGTFSQREREREKDVTKVAAVDCQVATKIDPD
jgi:hypothetical protein